MDYSISENIQKALEKLEQEICRDTYDLTQDDHDAILVKIQKLQSLGFAIPKNLSPENYKDKAVSVFKQNKTSLDNDREVYLKNVINSFKTLSAGNENSFDLISFKRDNTKDGKFSSSNINNSTSKVTDSKIKLTQIPIDFSRAILDYAGDNIFNTFLKSAGNDVKTNVNAEDFDTSLFAY